MLRVEQDALARQAEISAITLRRVDSRQGAERVSLAMIDRIRRALEALGAEFIEHEVCYRARPWVPRSTPKRKSGLDGHHPTRVLWTAGSTDQHLFLLALHQRHQRAGQSVARRHNPARRYASPLVIMAHTMRGSCWPRDRRELARRPAQSQQPAEVLPGLACRITVVAPSTNNWRNRSSPARLMPPRRVLPPVECSRGVNPSLARRTGSARRRFPGSGGSVAADVHEGLHGD